VIWPAIRVEKSALETKQDLGRFPAAKLRLFHPGFAALVMTAGASVFSMARMGRGFRFALHQEQAAARALIKVICTAGGRDCGATQTEFR